MWLQGPASAASSPCARNPLISSAAGSFLFFSLLRSITSQVSLSTPVNRIPEVSPSFVIFLVRLQPIYSECCSQVDNPRGSVLFGRKMPHLLIGKQSTNEPHGQMIGRRFSFLFVGRAGNEVPRRATRTAFRQLVYGFIVCAAVDKFIPDSVRRPFWGPIIGSSKGGMSGIKEEIFK